MTAAIKTFRPAPLLTPPEKREYDVYSVFYGGLVRRALTEESSSSLALDILYIMKFFCMDYQVTPKYERAAQNRLADARRYGKDHELAKVHFLMDELGIENEVWDGERERMRKELGKYRGMGKSIGEYEAIPWQINMMRKVGEKVDVTEGDREIMEYGIERYTTAKDGIKLAGLIAEMKSAGVEHTVTREETELMFKTIRELRENNRAYGYATMIYDLMRVFEQEKHTNPEMPPLKKL